MTTMRDAALFLLNQDTQRRAREWSEAGAPIIEPSQAINAALAYALIDLADAIREGRT